MTGLQAGNSVGTCRRTWVYIASTVSSVCPTSLHLPVSKSAACDLLAQEDDFTPATKAEIRTLFTQSPSESCGLNPIPTWLLKENLDTLLPYRRRSSTLRSQLVTSQTRRRADRHSSLFKRINLDPELLKNFRPLSNLLFLSKLVERVVAD